MLMFISIKSMSNEKVNLLLSGSINFCCPGNSHYADSSATQ